MKLYIYLSVCLSVCLCIYIYIYVCVCVCVCVWLKRSDRKKRSSFNQTCSKMLRWDARSESRRSGVVAKNCPVPSAFRFRNASGASQSTQPFRRGSACTAWGKAPLNMICYRYHSNLPTPMQQGRCK